MQRELVDQLLSGLVDDGEAVDIKQGHDASALRKSASVRVIARSADGL
jgi:hypothetical protein